MGPFYQNPGDLESPQARCYHYGQNFGFYSNKQGTTILIAHLTGCQWYKIHKKLMAKNHTKLSHETMTVTDGCQREEL